MEFVFSLFLFALAIGYVEYRLKSLRKDTDKEQSGAIDFFATKEELKKVVNDLKEQADADRLAADERMASNRRHSMPKRKRKRRWRRKQVSRWRTPTRRSSSSGGRLMTELSMMHRGSARSIC